MSNELGRSDTFNISTLKGWGSVNAFLSLLGCVSLSVFATAFPLAIAAGVSFSWLLVSYNSVLSAKGFAGGYANQITLLRLVLVLSILINLSTLSERAAFLLFFVVVLLDVLDGAVARKFELGSVFGMHFDMEVDALFVLAAGCYFYTTTSLGLVLLLPGALRYIYVISVMLFPKDGFAETKRSYAAWAAGINFCLLTVATLAGGLMQSALLLCSCALVCLSFGLSFFEYFRRDCAH